MQCFHILEILERNRPLNNRFAAMLLYSLAMLSVVLRVGYAGWPTLYKHLLKGPFTLAIFAAILGAIFVF
jgi:hypothetical protein